GAHAARVEDSKLAESIACPEQPEHELAAMSRRARDADPTTLNDEQRVGRLSLPRKIGADLEGTAMDTLAESGPQLGRQAGEERRSQEHRQRILTGGNWRI